MYKFYFNFRMNERTKRQLCILSKTLQRSKSNLLRWLVHEEYVRWGLDTSEQNESHTVFEEEIPCQSHELKDMGV